MILEEQELINHTMGNVSIPPSPTRQVDSLPARQDSQPARTGRAEQEGFSHADIEALNEALELEDDESVPRLVIRGAQIPQTTPPPQKTNIDYLAFTSEETPSILRQFVEIFLPKVAFFPASGGFQGYKHYISLSLYGQTVGRIAYGSQHERNYVQLSGEACRHIDQWHHVVHYLTVLTKAKLSRVDIAADYYYGEIDLDNVKTAYDNGKFKLAKARENPTFDLRRPIGGNGIPLGWTAYLGKRTNGKFARVYHKGAQMFGKLSEKQQDDFSHIWGEINVGEEYNPPSGATYKNWVRAEVEYKSKDRILPFEVITDRDNYFSGAYPYFEELLPMAQPKRPKTLPNTLQTDIEIMFANMSQQYGSFVTTMLASGMTSDEICKKIVNGRLSQRIIKAGGLEIIQPYNPEVLKAPQDE